MKRPSTRENIQQQMQLMSYELSKLQSSQHVLNGQKSWHVFDRKKETLEKQLRESIEEYQRILCYSFKETAPTAS